MEKSATPNIEQPALDTAAPGRRRTPSLKASAVVLFLVAFFSLPKWIPGGDPKRPISSLFRTSQSPSLAADFDWDSLPTKSHLDYSDCFDGLGCARLELPMDYWNGTTNASISLAVIRRPAKVPVSHPQYGGAVLINPGGPGGSGVSLLKNSGKQIAQTIDAPEGSEGKFYDIVSFDPRGVVNTKPTVQCVKDSGLMHSWQVRIMEEGVMEASDAALGRLWSMSTAYSASCSLPLPDGGPDIRKYVTTASVARDMLELVEKHGEWREMEATRLLARSCGRHASKAVEVPESVRYHPGSEKIQYIGYSYGTYLGNTFAAMFPDRIHRLIVDGVVDAYNYKASLWSDNLIDTEADMNLFYYHCARVGFPTCALANETGETTAQGVSDRVANITNSLYHNPLPVIGPIPEVVTLSDVRNLIFGALYTPIQSFPFVANLLAGVEKGNGTEFAKLLQVYHGYHCPPKKGDEGFSIIPLRNISADEATGMSHDGTMAIACSDGDEQSWVNRTMFEKYAKELASVSPSIGSLWSAVRMHCIHYSIRPYYRFEGPWKAKTSHPLLMIGNTADPVTPVKHARNMAKGFEGAVALTQDSAGHCSASTYSNCTYTYIRQYFQTGELPPANTTCPADEFPFGPGPNETAVVDVAMLEARRGHAELHAGIMASGGALMQSPRRNGMASRWLI